MKRDFDRIRQILLDCESNSDAEYALPEPISDFDQYQIGKMAEAGLIVLTTPKSFGIFGRPSQYSSDGFIGYTTPTTVRMTWTGHDYLDAVRNAGIWEETKAAVAQTGGNATLEILKALALGFAKKKISDHTGIDLS